MIKHMHSPYGDPCNPYCEPYDGTDFNSHLEVHMHRSAYEEDMYDMRLPWDPKTTRRNVVKFWYELSADTKKDWKEYPKKFGKDVKDDVPKKYDEFMEYLDTLDQTAAQANAKGRADWEEMVIKAYDDIFG